MRVRRGGYAIAVVASAALLAGGVLLAVREESGPSGPAGAVRAYFAALARSDAPAALALGDRPGGPTGFLTGDVLALQQHLAPLHDVLIRGVDGAGAQRTVRYSYALGFPDGDQAVTGEVRVVQHGADWRLATSAVPVHLQLSAASARATLAGAAVPDDPVALFPGAVPVRFDTAELAVEHGSVTFGAAPDLALQVVVSAAGRVMLTAAMAHQLRICFPAGGFSPAQCPLPGDPRVVPHSLRGTVAASGINHLDYGVSLYASGPIRITGTLSFTGSYDRLDDNNIARTLHGVLALQVSALTPSVAPVRVQFVAASS